VGLFWDTTHTPDPHGGQRLGNPVYVYVGAGMRVVTIIIIIVLCLVAVQVIGIVAYFAAKRYYYDHIRPKNRFKRLETLAMFIPAASAKIDRLKRHVKKRQTQRMDKRDSSQSEMLDGSAENVVKIYEPDNEASVIGIARPASEDTS